MKSTLVLIAVIMLGFAAQFGLSRVLEKNQTQLSPEAAEEDLYFKGDSIKQISLGFDGMIADYYWMSALQYVGRKVGAHDGDLMLDDLKPLDPRLLYPMLDTATTLDPQLDAAYAYGSTVLPSISIEQAVKISQKGIAANPDDWRMYHRLGYIFWKNGEFTSAAEIYANGAAKPNAPDWMPQMSARLQAEGGSRVVAREMYGQMLVQAQDEQTKDLMTKRLLQIESFDERDAIGAALEDFEQKNNRCPQNWREIYAQLKTVKTVGNKSLRLDASGAPVDPADTPYLLVSKNGKCTVALGDNSIIPYK